MERWIQRIERYPHAAIQSVHGLIKQMKEGIIDRATQQPIELRTQQEIDSISDQRNNRPTELIIKRHNEGKKNPRIKQTKPVTSSN